MIRRYRKKPITIEAIQWTGDNMAEVTHFGEGKCAVKHIKEIVLVSTLEGDMIANKGDYIIKGIAGEFYPCKEDIFTRTYEAVPELTREAEEDWFYSRGLKKRVRRLSEAELAGLEGVATPPVYYLIAEVREYRQRLEDDLK